MTKAKFTIFKDRREAGFKLSQKLAKYKREAFVLAIPNGGVEVGAEIASSLGAQFDVMIVRKIQLPWDTESGFGACSSSGCFILNQQMIADLGLTFKEVENQKKKTIDKIEDREEKYRGKKHFPIMRNKIVILVDDGLATGYTMIAACRDLRKKNPKKIIVAVPCASAEAVARLHAEADEIVSLNVKDTYPFAVAEFYKNWYDISDEEVLNILKKFSTKL